MFTARAIQLLNDNFIRNDRAFYMAHKAEFDQYVQQPMKEVAALLMPDMLTVDPDFESAPARCLSRLIRDSRRVRDGILYKDHIWISFRIKAETIMPGYYFEIDPSGYSYGMGMYASCPAHMRTWRDMLAANPARFEQTAQLLRKTNGVTSLGEKYKKARPNNLTGEVAEWYQLKELHFSAGTLPAQRLYDGSFLEPMRSDLLALAPLYRLLKEVAGIAQVITG